MSGGVRRWWCAGKCEGAFPGRGDSGGAGGGCLGGEGEAERGASPFHAFHGDFPAVSFGDGLHDGESEAHAAGFFGIGFSLLEDLVEKVRGDAGAVVADAAFDDAFRGQFLCADDDLTAGGVFEGVGHEVLQESPQETGIGIHEEAVGDFIEHFGAGGVGHGMEVVDEGLDEGPEVELAAHEFHAGISLEVGVFFEDLGDEVFELLYVPAQGAEHGGGILAEALFLEDHGQDAFGHGNGVERGAEVVGDKGEVVFAALLDFAGAFGGVGLEGEADGVVEDEVDDVEGLPLEVERVVVGEGVNAAAEHVVLGDDFFDVEAVLEPLVPMDGGAALGQCSGDGLVGLGLECRG